MATASLIIHYRTMTFTNAYAGVVITPLQHQTSTSFASPSSNRYIKPLTIICCTTSDSNSGQGFGPNKASTAKDGKDGGRSAASRRRKSVPQQPGSIPNQAPATNYGMDAASKSFTSDLEFEEKLQAVKRSALNQKKAEEKNMYGTIDYDAPVASEPNKIGLGTKIGVGIAVVVFGLVFALGDFSPSGSVNSNKDAAIEKNTLSPEEKETLQTRLQQYEATLGTSPDDLVAREGAAVTLTELGDYTRAASMLEDLTKMKPSDPEVFRLLGDVKLELKDFEGSAAAYRSSAKISNKMDFQVLRGLTNALLAAKKPDEAVQILLATRNSLERQKSNQENIGGDNSQADAQSQLDPIQARFFAPEGAKAVVDRYSR
ncbi:hypothetical protein M8C21_033537 [Ambrosia artemisiifolia]|uniref:Uncharacterized protein n=1 Tax=Ambrosia artemisiifolia TaxID=4212 RepID=A0AAD5D704_AMBAR|nr:hypothetical protein M8C21_033537 [Ambrosia artemisiifolia]